MKLQKNTAFAQRKIDWYLPHYSSDYFRDRFYQGMVKAGFEIPYKKWYTNLPVVGNIGSASIFLLMEGLLKGGKIKKGDKVLCFIPESGRVFPCLHAPDSNSRGLAWIQNAKYLSQV